MRTRGSKPFRAKLLRHFFMDRRGRFERVHVGCYSPYVGYYSRCVGFYLCMGCYSRHMDYYGHYVGCYSPCVGCYSPCVGCYSRWALKGLLVPAWDNATSRPFFLSSDFFNCLAPLDEIRKISFKILCGSERLNTLSNKKGFVLF